MKRLDLAKATAPLSQYARKLSSGPVLLTENGVPVAALLSVEDIDLENLSLSTNPKFLAIIERSRRRHEQEGGVTIEQLRRRLGIKNGRRKR